MLELLGCGTERSSLAAVCGAGSLTLHEASAACKCAVSLLLPPHAEEEGGAEGGRVAGEGAAGSGEGGLNQEDAGGGGGLAFPLDIDQEVGDFTRGVGNKGATRLVRVPKTDGVPTLFSKCETGFQQHMVPSSTLAVYPESCTILPTLQPTLTFSFP